MVGFSDAILKEIEDNEDGSFQIRNKKGYAVLVVNKPGKFGRSVTTKEVLIRLEIFGIQNFDKAKIESIVRASDGKEYPIAEWKGGTPEDSRIEIEISDDRMKVYIKVFPPKHGGDFLTVDKVVQQLKDTEVVYGIKEDIIEDILNKQLFFVKSIVAEGTPPIPGKNGHIKVLFDYSNKPSIGADVRGRVDYKEIGVIKSVQKEQVLAERVNAEPGKPGKDVHGKEIPGAEGSKAIWRIGANCKLSEDETKLLSLIDGRPVQERDGSIKVDEICLLENVDYSTGNVDFPGTIVVEGKIADNFRLSTKGSLIIKKSVGRVFLFAEGDIVLSGGVMGKNGGLIESNSDIYAKFAEQATLKAKKSIFITEASMHSSLVAGEDIILQGGRGELIGGEAVAGVHLYANKIGAVVETKTNIVIGIPPERLDEIEKLKAEINNKTGLLKKIRSTLNKFLELSSKRDLSEDEKEVVNKLQEAENKFSTQLKSAIGQYDYLLSFDPSPESYIEVEKVLFPKVSISFGKGKVFSSELQTYEGKNYIYISEDTNPAVTNFLPKYIKKREANPPQ